MDVELDQKKEMETSGESKGMNRLMAAVNLSFSFRTHQSWTHQREGREHLWNLNLGSVRQSLTSRIFFHQLTDHHTIGIIIDWILDVLTLFFYKSSTQLFWNDWKDNSQMKPIQQMKEKKENKKW